MSTAIVSHDAGGAEILSSYVKRHPLSPIFVLEGPAKKVFERKLGSVKTTCLDVALDKATSLLCSTSWQSDLELHAIHEIKKRAKPSVAFLDHWVNYRNRFIRNGEIHLPDQLWVGDPAALKIAREVFPERPISLKENPYFLDIQEEIETIAQHQKNDDGLSILYVCEPIKKHAKLRYGNERHWGYVEEDALRFGLNNVSVFGSDIREIRLRPHPSEEPEKYTWVFNEFSLPIVQGGDQSLLEEIAVSDVVLGCQSMAMVIAILVEKQVVSCIPPNGGACALPFGGIQYLRDLVFQK